MRPSLLLLSGILCDGRVWEPQRAGFAATHDVAVPNLLGFSSLTAMAENVLANAPPRFSLAGHSMGGRVCLEILRLAPKRVERVALLDTGVHPLAPGERETREELIALAHDKGMEALARRFILPMVHPGRAHEESLVRPLLEMVMRISPQDAEGQLRAMIARPDATAELRRIACPALVLCGREDRWSPPERHAWMAGEIPGARLAIIEDSAHMTTLEQPQAVNTAMADWLHMPAAA